MALGPVLLLLILNSAIVLIMRQTCAGVSDRNANQGGSDITTLVLVVCLFIACNILVSCSQKCTERPKAFAEISVALLY